jgi:ATP-binding cassette subfamily B protein
VLSDAVSNQSTVTLFAAAPYEYRIFGDAVERWRAVTMRSWNADAWILAIQGLFAIAIEIALLAGGVLLWQQGAITVGDFVLIQVYIIGLVDRIWNLGNSMRRVYNAFADAHEMIAIFETPLGIQDVPDAPALAVAAGKIELRDVAFGYGEGSPTFSGLSLTIDAGERVALVGTSGAGKSTITKLLLRLHDVTGGSIEIDGQDIARVTQDSLRAAISFVPQEPILFHRSLRDNIRYGKPDATDEEVIEAAKKARCHEFITKLTEGYDTHVGERGIKLSGGERQRVAIARAILKDAPILILDEATSSLDSESEALIQEALDELMRRKTVIVIAHRLSTIMRMDRIVVIEGGKIVAQGTHQELLDHEGSLYHKLWSIQAGSFVSDTELSR